jgi:hypothetical protein
MQTAQTFTVHQDPDYGFIVADAAIGAKSFAMVPVDHTWSFATKDEARAQAKALSGQTVATRMFETPDRFEAVADTLYGPAWE